MHNERGGQAMEKEQKKKHLSEIIDYDTDIAPYQFIKIFAGVGSGKNGFVDRLIQGNYFKHADGSYVGKKHILLITSRRSKVNEQLNSKDVVYDPAIGAFDGLGMNWLAYDDPKYADYYDSPMMYLEDPNGWGTSRIFLRSCANTNAKIEWNLKMHFMERDMASHPWERFDMIVIDEVHAVLSDASYQSAPFYVRRLIEETLRRSDKCKVIVMTGTPEVLDRYPLFDDAHLIDRMDACISVRPQSIEFVTRKEAEDIQQKMLQRGEKFVAFFNHIADMRKLNRKYPDQSAISFSDKKKRDALKREDRDTYDKMISAETHIAMNKRLPDDLTAFLCTSRHKEGINIENEDISAMFIEAHAKDEILQMAGRVRNPVEKLYLIFNSTPHPDMELPLESDFSMRDDIINSVNRYFQEKCDQHAYPLFDDEAWVKPVYYVDEVNAVLEYIHKKFPYIRFDYFTKQFVPYPERVISKAYYREQQNLFAEASGSETGLVMLAQQWYPGIECSVSKKMGQLLFMDKKDKVDKYLSENHWLNGERTIRQAERQQILAELKEILVIEDQTMKLSSLLKKLKYKLVPETKSKNANAPYRIEPIG